MKNRTFESTEYGDWINKRVAMRSLLFLFVEAWSGVSPTAELGEGDGGGDGDVEALGGGDAGGERGYE